MAVLRLVEAHDDHPAYARIRAAIVEGRYAPGERLIELKLADELQISRTPIREALRRLEADGLVIIERNRGAMVRPMTLAEVVDLYELRARLEGYAAELAAERATDTQRAGLVEAAERFSELRADPRIGGAEGVHLLSEANRVLHDSILAAAHHDRLGSLLARTVDIPLVFRAFSRFGPTERERSDLFHHLIVGAIVAGEPQRAARLMAEHISLGRDALVAGWPEPASPPHSLDRPR